MVLIFEENDTLLTDLLGHLVSVAVGFFFGFEIRNIGSGVFPRFGYRSLSAHVIADNAVESLCS